MGGSIRTGVRRRRSPVRTFALRAIETYQRDVSHRLRTRCSFEHSCSHYSHDAFEHHSSPVALAMTAHRLQRCHRMARRGHPNRALRIAGATLVLAAAVLLFPLLTLPASAATAGCTATLAGVDATTATSPGSAITVDKGAAVTASGSMESGPITYKVDLEFAGISWNVASGSGEGNSWTSQVNVDDYATHGVGLYKVNVESTNAAGQTCSLQAFVNVSGGPLSSTAGKVAAGAIAVGAVGVAGATAVAAKPKIDRSDPQWAEKLTSDPDFRDRFSSLIHTYATCGQGIVAAVFMSAAAILRSKGMS